MASIVRISDETVSVDASERRGPVCARFGDGDMVRLVRDMVLDKLNEAGLSPREIVVMLPEVAKSLDISERQIFRRLIPFRRAREKGKRAG